MRILCVDDDGIVLAVTSDLLRALGHEVIEASSGQDAAQTIADPSIDVLITDIHMPGGPGGVELVDYARRIRPGLPVIFFTGMGDAPLGVRDVLLRKPCSLGELQNALSSVVM